MLAPTLGSGRSPGEESGNRFQSTCLGNLPEEMVCYNPWGRRVKHMIECTRRSDEPKKCEFLIFLGDANVAGQRQSQFKDC